MVSSPPPFHPTLVMLPSNLEPGISPTMPGVYSPAKPAAREGHLWTRQTSYARLAFPTAGSCTTSMHQPTTDDKSGNLMMLCRDPSLAPPHLVSQAAFPSCPLGMGPPNPPLTLPPHQ